MTESNAEYLLRRDNSELNWRIAQLEEIFLEHYPADVVFQDTDKRDRWIFESARDGDRVQDAEIGKVVEVNPGLAPLRGGAMPETNVESQLRRDNSRLN
ncbi:MAG TPA: hypothetical protein VHP14_21880, partial [Anaerolineales bacterium]|nr:hypothetical protein [Anaerolineales bacterium]